jgi:hypothetical protein
MRTTEGLRKIWQSRAHCLSAPPGRSVKEIRVFEAGFKTREADYYTGGFQFHQV